MAKSAESWTVLRMLEWGTGYFEDKQVKSPRMSIEWLLSDVLGVKRLDLYLMYDRPLAAAELDQIKPLIKRRADHEPLQYITGHTPFVHAEIEVNNHVLIPRIETEYMVELILEQFEEQEDFKVLDAGTGSGCIPVALKMKRPSWQIDAFDISEEALELASRNAESNNCEINFFRDDFYDPKNVGDKIYDLIISNPPYVLEDEKESLDREVVEFEPHLALFADSTEEVYQSLYSLTVNHLKKGGHAYFEINQAESNQVKKIWNFNEWETQILRDQEGRKRFLIVKRLP